MNSVFVYCEIEEGAVADVSLELLTKGRTLASKLGVKLEAIALGSGLRMWKNRYSPTVWMSYGKETTSVWLPTQPYLILPYW